MERTCEMLQLQCYRRRCWRNRARRTRLFGRRFVIFKVSCVTHRRYTRLFIRLALTGDIPQPDLVTCQRSQSLSVRAKVYEPHDVLLPREREQLPLRRDVPQLYCFVKTSRCQQLPIRTQRHDEDWPGVSCESRQLLARHHVPQFDCRVITGRCECLSVRCEGDGPHPSDEL